MCTARVQLVYGLWVTTASLSFSIAGLQSRAGAQQAINLISLRARRGTLVISHHTGYTPLASLPVEIWNMVRREVLLDAIQQAQYDTMDQLRCRECDTMAIVQFYEDNEDSATFAEDLQSLGKSLREWTIPKSEQDCEFFLHEIRQTPPHFLPEPEVTRKVLGEFGLALPDHCTDYVAGFWRELHFDATTLIIFPPRPRPFPSVERRNEPQIEVEFCQDGSRPKHRSESLEIHSSTFDVPTSAQRRFARAVSSLGLKVVSPGEKYARSSLDEDSRQHLRSHEPRWMLFCDDCGCYWIHSLQLSGSLGGGRAFGLR